jgi:hypothetical protein
MASRSNQAAEFVDMGRLLDLLNASERSHGPDSPHVLADDQETVGVPVDGLEPAIAPVTHSERAGTDFTDEADAIPGENRFAAHVVRGMARRNAG